MGFGMILYGFLMMIEITVRTNVGSFVGIDIFPDLAGYLLMLTAARRLDGYAKGFSYFRKLLYPLLVLSAGQFVIGLVSIFGRWFPLLEALTDGIKWLSLILQAAAFFFLFAGIMSLAKEVELDGIASRAKFTTVIGAIYYLFQVVMTLLSKLPFGISPNTLAPFQLVLMLFWLIFIILGEVVLFNCYRYICYEGEEMLDPLKIESPIAKFLNKVFKKNQ